MSASTQVWLLMAAAGLGTFAIRYSFIGLVKSGEVPRWAERMLRHVPSAALTALVVSSVGGHGAQDEAASLRLGVLVLAGLIAYLTRSMFATIAGGMAGLWALKFLLG